MHIPHLRLPRRRSSLSLPLSFCAIYLLCLLLYFHIIFTRLNVSPSHAKLLPPGHADLHLPPNLTSHVQTLCRYRLRSAQTIIAHLHIPKSGGTAFALALKSECRCNNIPRPQRGYCKECPHVLPDDSQPPPRLTQNLWTLKNESFYPSYAHNCRTYNASSRFFGFPRRNRTHTFYSQNRLTSGWPCGVHVGYARMRMCCHRLQLQGIHHVMVTLFRNPLARFVSEYYQVAYNRRAISSWDWCMNRTKPLSLSQFIHMPVSYPFQSRMTKLLSASPTQTCAAGADWSLPGIRQIALTRALEVLHSDEDFVFGLAENLSQTLQLFQFLFRRRFDAPSTCHSHQNSSGCAEVNLGLHDRDGNPLTIPPSDMHQFSLHNAEDVLLYDHASQIFYSRVQAMYYLQSLGSDASIDRRCKSLTLLPPTSETV